MAEGDIGSDSEVRTGESAGTGTGSATGTGERPARAKRTRFGFGRADDSGSAAATGTGNATGTGSAFARIASEARSGSFSRQKATPSRRTLGIPADAFEPFYLILFAAVAKRRSEVWQLDKDEAHQLSIATANLVRHIPLPDEQTGPAIDVIAFASAVVAIVGSRMMMEGALASLMRQPEAADFARNGGGFAAEFGT